MRSIGVLSNDHRYPNNLIGNRDGTLMSEDSSDATEETEFDGEKIHPQSPGGSLAATGLALIHGSEVRAILAPYPKPVRAWDSRGFMHALGPQNTLSGSYGSHVIKKKIHPQPGVVRSKSNICGDKDIVELFSTVSALKLSYIQLQQAHIPYDPDKIVAADELVVVQLEALRKFKKAFKEKRFLETKLDPSRFDCLRSEIDVFEKLLENLKSQNRDKDAEIVRLQQELYDLDSGNMALAEKIRGKSLERENMRILNVSMFEDAFRRASKSIHDFGRPIICLMQTSGWDLNLAAKSIENGVVYAKRSDKKYAFEAYIARRMFHGLSLKSYNVDDVLRFDDPIDSLIENPSSEFANFCGKKYMFVVHPMMEMSFFRNLDQRMLVSSGKHPRTPFYQIFARMAKWVWILQGIATSIDPNSQIFSVNRGSKFSDVYMESVEEKKEGVVVSDGGQSNFKVEFMVMPGFRIGSTLLKSRVYLSEMKHSTGK